MHSGLRVDTYSYTDPSRGTMIAWNAMAHSEENNKFVPTSLKLKAMIVTKVFNECGKGVDEKERWNATCKELLKIYGPGKRTTVWRWISVAKALEPSVLEKCSTRSHFPQSYVFENKYFLAVGADAKYRLSETYKLKVLDALFDSLGSGCPVTTSAFQSDLCMPMKYVETWVATNVKKFGQLANSPPFERICRNLTSMAGLARVKQCLLDKTPLEGKGTTPGIEECNLIVDEMSKRLAGSTHGVGGSAPQDGPGSSSAGGSAPQGCLEDSVHPSHSSNDECDLALDLECQTDVIDPTQEKVQRLVQAELTHVSLHESFESLKQDWESSSMSNKVIGLVDCPTSKPKLVLDRVTQMASLLLAKSDDAKFVICVTIGFRYDLLAAVSQKLKTLYPTASLFVVTLTPGKGSQGARRRATYAVVAQSRALKAEHVPFQAEVMNGKAHGYENLRFRCVNRDCPFREDDLQFEGLDELLDAIEISTEDNPNGEIEKNDVPDDSRYVVDIFPFGQCMAYYTSLLKTVCRVETARDFILLTSTSHPNAWISARRCGLRCFVFCAGPSKHAMSHGQDVAENILVQICWPSALLATQAQTDKASINKRQLDALQYIVVTAPPKQVVQLFDIAPQSTWRSGLNRRDLDLEKIMPDLLATELAENELDIQMTDKGRSLFSLRGIKEGQQICTAKVLLFENKDGLQSFLQSDSARAYLCDRVVHIRNVHKGPEETPVSMYGLLVGCAGYLQHYQGIRRSGPNARLIVNCAAGPNDGFLTVICSTRNGTGIGPKGEIVINYGLEYDMTIKAPEPVSKRFKGALDTLFSKLADAGQNGGAAAGDDEGSAPQGGGRATCTFDGGSAPQGGCKATGTVDGGFAPQGGGKATGTCDGGFAPQGNGQGGPSLAGSSVPQGSGSGPEGSAPDGQGLALALVGPAPEGGGTGGAGSQSSGGQESAPEHMHPALKECATQGWVHLSKDVCGGWGCLFLPGTGGGGTLRLYHGHKVNKKLPPNSHLATFKDGKICDGSDVPFAFTGPAAKTYVFLRKGSGFERTTLKDLISSSKAEKVHAHNRFAPGKAPVALQKTKNMMFNANDDKVRGFLKFASKLQGFELTWILRMDTKDNCLYPYGLLLTNKKQIVLAAGKTLDETA